MQFHIKKVTHYYYTETPPKTLSTTVFIEVEFSTTVFTEVGFNRTREDKL